MNQISSRSPLRYPGGKFRARKILLDYIPTEVSHVLSPFLGGGSFELFLTDRGVKVTASDGFPLLANFWEELTKNPVQLAERVRPYSDLSDPHHKPLSKAYFSHIRQFLKGFDTYAKVQSDVSTLDLAAKFFLVNRASFSGATMSGGFSAESASSRLTASITDRLEEWHNPLLEVSYGIFEDVLADVSSSIDFLFLDPPYLLEKKSNKLYGIEGNMHMGFDHQVFRDMTVSTGLPFTLTYNNSDAVRELWEGFNIYSAEWSYGMNKSKVSSEIIITNHDARPAK